MRVRWIALVVTGVLAACAKAEDDKKEASVPSWPVIQVVRIEADVSTIASAHFYSAPHQIFPGLVLDTCFNVTPPTADPPTTLDAGSSIELSSPGGTIELVRGEGGLYEGEGSELVSTSPMDLIIHGGEDIRATTISGAVPSARLSAFTGSLAITRGQDYSLTWDGSGPGWVTAQFLGGTFVSCRAHDDGSFTIPAAYTAQIGSDGNALLVTHEMQNLSDEDLELVGHVAGHADPLLVPYTTN